MNALKICPDCGKQTVHPMSETTDVCLACGVNIVATLPCAAVAAVGEGGVMAYEIEKNIPLVQRRGPRYPFRKMDVGDSFEFPEAERQKIGNAALKFGQCNGMKFTVQKTGEDAARCWRVE